jgi:hypothetical protein
MVTRTGMNWFTIIVLTFAAGLAAAQVVVASPQQEFIPNPPDDEPETTTTANGPNLPVADAVYRVEKSGQGEIESGHGEVQPELVRWHGGWGWRHGGAADGDGAVVGNIAGAADGDIPAGDGDGRGLWDRCTVHTTARTSGTRLSDLDIRSTPIGLLTPTVGRTVLEAMECPIPGIRRMGLASGTGKKRSVTACAVF